MTDLLTGQTRTEWGVRAFHPCPQHGAKCPHSRASVTKFDSRELAEWGMSWVDIPGVDVAVDRELVRREVSEWRPA